MKAPKRKLENTEPDFITKSELAFHLGSSTQAIDQWIARRIIPPPIARLGERHSVWLRKH